MRTLYLVLIICMAVTMVGCAPAATSTAMPLPIYEPTQSSFIPNDPTPAPGSCEWEKTLQGTWISKNLDYMTVSPDFKGFFYPQGDQNNLTQFDWTCIMNGYFKNSTNGSEYPISFPNPDIFVMNGDEWFRTTLDETCPKPTSADVILYQHWHIECGGEGENNGWILRNGAGFQTVAESFNDRASSIYIRPGKSVRLYEHIDPTTGGSICLNSSTLDFWSTLSNGVLLNDQVSSFEIFDTPDCDFSHQGITTIASGETDVIASAGGVVNGGSASVNFPAGSLSNDATVIVSELGENEKIAGGIQVELSGVPIQQPVEFSFPIKSIPPGEIIQMVEFNDISQNWEPASLKDGTQVMGIVTQDGRVLAGTDHFSAYGVSVSELAKHAANAYRLVEIETYQAAFANGSAVWIPRDYRSDAILDYGSLMGRIDDPLGLLCGLNDDNCRKQRYVEVLTDLYVNAPVEAPSGELLDRMLGNLGVGEIIVDGASEYILYDQEALNTLRSFRGDVFNWPATARLDYVADRIAGFLEGMNATMAWMETGYVVVGKDLARVLLYHAWEDDLIHQRMESLEATLQPLCDAQQIDRALCDALAETRAFVTARLDNYWLGLPDAFLDNIIPNIEVYGYITMAISQGSWMAVAKIHPIIGVLFTAAEIYNEAILIKYANIQRATLAATLLNQVFIPTLNAVGDLPTDQAISVIHLSKYFFERLKQSWLNDLADAIYACPLIIISPVVCYLTENSQISVLNARNGNLNAKIEILTNLEKDLVDRWRETFFTGLPERLLPYVSGCSLQQINIEGTVNYVSGGEAGIEITMMYEDANGNGYNLSTNNGIWPFIFLDGDLNFSVGNKVHIIGYLQGHFVDANTGEEIQGLTLQYETCSGGLIEVIP
jgi:hypothetical protein